MIRTKQYVKSLNRRINHYKIEGTNYKSITSLKLYRKQESCVFGTNFYNIFLELNLSTKSFKKINRSFISYIKLF